MEKKSYEIKIAGGVILNYDGMEEVLKGPADIWQVFKWDIVNDENAKQCADIIARELLCFGYIDLSAMCNGHTCTLTMIPPTEENK